MKRLDIEIAERGICRSRSQAKDLIYRDKVLVNGEVASKASALVSPNDKIELSEMLSFASRAGEKLAFALNVFSINVNDRVAIDIGSSTGGFTDCLLRAGAAKVVAVDVGTDQLLVNLRRDPKVEVFESTDIRKFKSASLFDIAVVDVSFISLSLVLPKIFELLKAGGKAVALVKPQFEVGMEIAKKYNGVIADESEQKKALERVKADAMKAGFKIRKEAVSPITGEKGNREFLLSLEK